MVRPNALDDQIFSSDIGLSDEIDIAFDTDLRGPKTLDQQVSRFTGDIDREVKHLTRMIMEF